MIWMGMPSGAICAFSLSWRSKPSYSKDARHSGEVDPHAAEVHYYLALVRSWQNHPRELVRHSVERAL